MEGGQLLMVWRFFAGALACSALACPGWVRAQEQDSAAQNEVERHRSVGDAHLASGEWEAAYADFEALVKQDPGDPDNYVRRGSAEYGMKVYDRAAEDFTKAISLYHDPAILALACYNRALCYQGLHDYVHAVQDYSRSLALGGPNTDAYEGRGTVQLARKQYREAIADLSRAIARDPRRYQAMELRGRAHLLLKEYRLAAVDYGLLARHEQRDAGLWSLYAGTLYLSGDVRAAIAANASAIRISPESLILFNQGLYYAVAGDWNGAHQWYRAALTSRKPGEPTLALQDVRRALAKRPHSMALLRAASLLSQYVPGAPPYVR